MWASLEGPAVPLPSAPPKPGQCGGVPPKGLAGPPVEDPTPGHKLQLLQVSLDLPTPVPTPTPTPAHTQLIAVPTCTQTLLPTHNPSSWPLAGDKQSDLSVPLTIPPPAPKEWLSKWWYVS